MSAASAEFGRVLAAMRKQGKLTQQDVADATGICRSSISKIESGGAYGLTIDQALSIADLLGVSVEQMAGGRVPAKAVAIAAEIAAAKDRLDSVLAEAVTP